MKHLAVIAALFAQAWLALPHCCCADGHRSLALRDQPAACCCHREGPSSQQPPAHRPVGDCHCRIDAAGLPGNNSPVLSPTTAPQPWSDVALPAAALPSIAEPKGGARHSLPPPSPSGVERLRRLARLNL